MAEEKKTKPVATVKTETLKVDTAKAAAEPAKEKAPVKKAAAKVAEKVATKKAAVKAEKAEVKAEKAEAKAAKAETKKAPAKKAAAKPAAKKAATAKEEAVKYNVSLQYQDYEWNVQALLQSAKDVWVYDMGRKAEEFKSVDLYVKPEEMRVYFVVDGKDSGDFAL